MMLWMNFQGLEKREIFSIVSKQQLCFEHNAL